MVCLETKNMILVPSICLEGRPDLFPPCAKRKFLFAVDIYKVYFLGPDKIVWREDLAPVMVLIPFTVVETVGRG